MNKPLGHTLLGSIFKSTKYRKNNTIECTYESSLSTPSAEKKVKKYESGKKADS